MILEFSVENFMSFKDLNTLQLQAAKIKSRFKEVDTENIFKLNNDFSLLKSKAIYGANASGKSNLITAIYVMKLLITDSLKDAGIIANFSKKYFYLNKINKDKPIFFQMIFTVDKIIYRYGFQIFKDAVLTEWLFGTPNKRETYYFLREAQEVTINQKRLKEGSKILSNKDGTNVLFRKDALFLTVLSAFNSDLANSIVSELSKIEIMFEASKDDLSLKKVLEYFDNTMLRTKIIEIMKGTDYSIKDVQKRNLTLNKEGEIYFIKHIYDENGKVIGSKAFNFNGGEVANGNRKMLLLSPNLAKSLMEGTPLIIDELDASLHPNLTRRIVKLYNSKQTNPENAQLIFVTHNSNLIDARLLRRDQICFVDKNIYGASRLTSLIEYKVRNDASFEKDYLKGKYSAIPYLNRFEWAFDNAE